MMERVHWSTKRIVKVRDIQQTPFSSLPGKPAGLWYAVRRANEAVDSWAAYCVENGMQRWKEYRHRYVLELDMRRMLRIRTAEELRALWDRYGVVWQPSPSMRMHLAWRQMAEEYDGIEIVPYQWSCRLAPSTMWYYGWDVASGCIWRARAVRALHDTLTTDVRRRHDTYTTTT